MFSLSHSVALRLDAQRAQVLIGWSMFVRLGGTNSLQLTFKKNTHFHTLPISVFNTPPSKLCLFGLYHLLIPSKRTGFSRISVSSQAHFRRWPMTSREESLAGPRLVVQVLNEAIMCHDTIKALRIHTSIRSLTGGDSRFLRWII